MLRPTAIIVNSATNFLGKISYSLYLSHPLLIYASGLTIWAASIAPLPWMVVPVVTLVTAAAAIPLAWFLFTFVEAPFIAIGRRATTKQVSQPVAVSR
jgi:peptidoglycan/LPS O-acetylase OafA/YrhL